MMWHQLCPPVGVKLEAGVKGEGSREVGWADLNEPCTPGPRVWLWGALERVAFFVCFGLAVRLFLQEHGLVRFSC